MWLVEQIADRGAQRARENESRPEQENPRDAGPMIKDSEYGEGREEHERPALKSESGVVRRPVSQSGPERLRKRDGEPVEDFDLRRRDGLNIDRTGREVPER